MIYKVGRNVLLFQQMERVLKYLVSHGNFAGTASELRSKFEKRKKSVSKRTLGMLAGDFLDDNESTPELENHTEIYFSFKFLSGVSEAMKSEIEELVTERNDLVHHFFESVETESVESWAQASVGLDVQEARLVRVTENLRSVARALSEGRKALAEFSQTEVFKKDFLPD